MELFECTLSPTPLRFSTNEALKVLLVIFAFRYLAAGGQYILPDSSVVA